MTPHDDTPDIGEHLNDAARWETKYLDQHLIDDHGFDDFPPHVFKEWSVRQHDQLHDEEGDE